MSSFLDNGLNTQDRKYTQETKQGFGNKNSYVELSL